MKAEWKALMTDSYYSETEETEYRERYNVVYMPSALELHGSEGSVLEQGEIISMATGLDFADCTESNFIKYTVFNTDSLRKDCCDYTGIHSAIPRYVAALVSRADPVARVIISDDRSRNLFTVSGREGRQPDSVFIVFHRGNLVSAVLCSIVLQKGGVPVIGIAADGNRSSELFERFISVTPDLKKLSFIKGLPDTDVMVDIFSDLEGGRLNSQYVSKEAIDDGLWKDRNVSELKNTAHAFVRRIPFAGIFLGNKIRITDVLVERKPGYHPFLPGLNLSEDASAGERKPSDVINELLECQRDGGRLSARMYYFENMNLTDNHKSVTFLDKIIMSPLTISYMTELPVTAAADETVVRKLRASGLSLALLPVYSLDLLNIEIMDSELAGMIQDSGKSPEEFYSDIILKLRNRGIIGLPVFLFGMPHDYFRSPDDHSGKDFAGFCRKHRTGMLGCVYSDKNSANVLQNPGDDIFSEILSASMNDFFEVNSAPSDSWRESPLAVFYSMHNAFKACNSSGFMKAVSCGMGAWKKPTANGFVSVKERIYDSLAGVALSGLQVTVMMILNDRIRNSSKSKGIYHRLYEQEKSEEVRGMFSSFMKSLK